MRAATPRDSRTQCSNCYLRREICVCSILPTVRIRTEFLILRHVWEAERPSNTGRLVSLAMPAARIIPCGGGSRIGGPKLDEAALEAPGTWLLWPDGAGAGPEITSLAPPNRVVVLDATWHQARRLYRRMRVLQTIPRLVLPAPDQARDRLRRQRRADGMSTIEAVAAAVARLEGPHAARPLEKLYDEVVRRKSVWRWGRSLTDCRKTGSAEGDQSMRAGSNSCHPDFSL